MKLCRQEDVKQISGGGTDTHGGALAMRKGEKEREEGYDVVFL